MRQTIRAILADVAVSVVVVMLFGIALLEVVQEAVGRILPAAVSDAAFGVLVELVTAGLLVTPGVVVAVLLARRRAPRPGHCRRCGYDLRGNVSGVCPECGAKV